MWEKSFHLAATSLGLGKFRGINPLQVNTPESHQSLSIPSRLSSECVFAASHPPRFLGLGRALVYITDIGESLYLRRRRMQFYTTQQAADKLGISPYTLRRYVRRGWVRAGNLFGGSRYRFTQAQIDAIAGNIEHGGHH